MSILSYLNENYPIRRTDAQKKAFCDFVTERYGARVEETADGKNKNLVIGDPTRARTVCVAHYDTPARALLPNLMLPRNPVLFYAYQFLIVGILLATSFAVGLLAGTLTQQANASLIGFLLTYYFGFYLMLFAFTNKHNANDNTSGVAAVFALMEKLPAEQRSKAAFILWDNEEKGMLGSKAFAKEHPKLGHLALVVNLDCVGLGENIIMVVNKLARKLPAVDTLEKAMQNTSGRAFQMFRSVSWLLNSDHKSFKCGVMVCACRKAKVLGYYTPYIHTGKDTVIDGENIPYLAEGLSAFVAALPEENA